MSAKNFSKEVKKTYKPSSNSWAKVHDNVRMYETVMYSNKNKTQ